MPGLMEMIFGQSAGFKKLPTMNTEQQQMMGNYMQQMMGGGFGGAGAPGYQSGMNYLQDLYSQSPQAFSRMQEPYMRQFQQQTVPGLAERFSGAGGGSPMGGGRQSSAFNQAMGAAGGNLSAQLGGMFEGMRGQNLQNLLGFSQAPYQQAMGMMGLKPFGYAYQPGSTGLLGEAVSGLAGGMGGGMGLGMGNMLGGKMFGGGDSGGGGGGGGFMPMNFGPSGGGSYMGSGGGGSQDIMRSLGIMGY
jgi:hypothetical protein